MGLSLYGYANSVRLEKFKKYFANFIEDDFQSKGVYNLANPTNPVNSDSDNEHPHHLIYFFMQPSVLGCIKTFSPRRLIRRLRLGIEPINTAHRRRSTRNDFRFEVMHEVEHRLDKGTATETD